MSSPKCRPKECMTLTRELRLSEPPCDTCIASEFFSFWDRERGRMGCWIAHTALTALECSGLKLRFERALMRSRVSWDDVEALAVLHDVGKLSEPYGREVVPGHNVLSMVVASSVCGPYSPVTLAIFLHHEAMHWKELYKMGLHQHIANSLSQRVRRRIDQGFRLRDGYPDALERLQAFLDLIDVKKARGVVERIVAKQHYRMDPWDIDFYIGQLPPRAIALYWILFLADNRAASARETSEAYWLDIAKGALGEAGSPAELTDLLLRRSRRLTHISLTALPTLGGSGAPCH